jgi:Ricin-type beta-trefoil lectin domain-like
VYADCWVDADLAVDKGSIATVRTNYQKGPTMSTIRLKAIIGVAAIALAAAAVLAPTAAGAAPGGPSYTYLVVRHSQQCVDVAGASQADVAPVQQYACLGINQHNQQFELVGVAHTNYFELVANHSGKCLDVAGGSTADGTPVIQYTCGGDTRYNQQFQFLSVTPGYYEIVARHSGKCLDVRGASTASGAVLQQYTCLGANAYNQLFATHTDRVLKVGFSHFDAGLWHQATSAELIEEVDTGTGQAVRAYVIATTTSWSDSPFGFKGHTAVSLAPYYVVVPTLPGQPTGVSGFSSITIKWGGPGYTDVSIPVATATTSITPSSVFS